MFSSNSDFFSKTYQRFRLPIFRYVKERIRDEAVAEELTQEIFLKVFRFQESYEAGLSFSNWLWTIAKNTLTDYFRATRDGSDVSNAPRVDADEAPSLEQSAEALILRKDLRAHLIQMAKLLTPLQRRVLWLRIVHQLSFLEIAKRLDLSLSSVKNLAYRARLSLNVSV